MSAATGLTNENLTSGFPGFKKNHANESPEEVVETAESASEETPVAEEDGRGVRPLILKKLNDPQLRL